jgi:hypothetical protein
MPAKLVRLSSVLLIFVYAVFFGEILWLAADASRVGGEWVDVLAGRDIRLTGEMGDRIPGLCAADWFGCP